MTNPPGISDGRRPSKVDWVHEQLVIRINCGELRPGDRLVVDRLALDLGVSQAPVREAIRRLQAEGLLEQALHRSPRVVALSDQDFIDVMEVHAELESLAVAMSLPYLTAADLRRAAEVNGRLGVAARSEDVAAFMEASRDFHQIFHDACPNQYLVGQFRRSSLQLAAMRSASRGFEVVRALDVVQEHQRLLELIDAGAGATEIRQVVLRHRWDTISALRPPSLDGGR